MPPRPPHKHVPPHLLHRKPRHGSLFSVILLSFVISSVFTFIVASVMLYFKINVNVMIPALAPIWVGIATISYMAQTQNIK